MPESNETYRGLTLSWGQFAVAITSLIVSLAAPLLMFVDQTNVSLAVLNQRLTHHDEVIQQATAVSSQQERAIQRLNNSLTRLESRLTR